MLLLGLSGAARADWVTATIPVGSEPAAAAVNPATNRVYVANRSDGTVTELNEAAGDTATIVTDAYPTALAVNPLTNRVFVANESSGTVLIFDAGTRTRTILAAGNVPAALAVNATTSRTYVANKLSDDVTVIAGDTYVSATVPVDAGPSCVAVNPVTNLIYVACSSNNSVVVVDGASDTTVSIPVGADPTALAVNPATNRIYVANAGEHALTVIDGATNGTTSVPLGHAPTGVGVNPATNRIYVLHYDDDALTVLDGATNDTTPVATGDGPRSLAVNPVSNKIYVTNALSNDVTIVDGATNSTALVSVGSEPEAVALNPVTDRVYVANRASSAVTVIAGANTYVDNVTVGSHPRSVVVNPVTNLIYVANRGGSTVTVIDGADNGTTTLPAHDQPGAAAVNPVNNRIYVANSNSNDVTVIYGTTNDTALIPVGADPSAVAVNPATNLVYVANYDDHNVTVINPWQGATYAVNVGLQPDAIVVNPLTGRVFVADYGSGDVTLIDGRSLATSTVTAGSGPCAVGVNQVTNRVYVANRLSNDVTVFDPDSGSPVQVAAGTAPCALAVNSVTNRIYVANPGSNDVTVIDGATNQAHAIPVGVNPVALAVNPVTNQIYVANAGDGSVTVIDGTTGAARAVTVGGAPGALALNPVTGRAYIGDSAAGAARVMREAPSNDTKVRVRLFGANPVTTWPQPSLNGEAVNRSNPNRTSIVGVLNRRNSTRLSWKWAGIVSGQGTDSVGWTMKWGSDSLAFGENYVCAVPLEADAGTTGNTGPGTPYAGNLFVQAMMRRKFWSDVAVVTSASGTTDSGVTFAPQCSLYNFSEATQNCHLAMKIGTGYNETIVAAGLLPHTGAIATFPDWIAGPNGWVATTCSLVSADLWSSNNTAHDSIYVRHRNHDVGVVQIITPIGAIDSGTSVVPVALVGNFGDLTETFQTRLSIGGAYLDSATVTLTAGQTDSVRFPSWDVEITGTFEVRCTTMMYGDMNPANDLLTDSVTVLGATEGTIYGSVSYYHAPNPPVDSAAVILSGGAADTVLSDLTGDYLLPALPLLRNYTVQPEKRTPVRQNAVTSFDAALDMLHAIRRDTLDSLQFIAGDVSGDSTVSAFDAGLILRYEVGLIQHFPCGARTGSDTVDWAFWPPMRTYDPLTSTQAGQDYRGILYGDPSGNWPGSGLPGGWDAASSEGTETDFELNISGANCERQARLSANSSQLTAHSSGIRSPACRQSAASSRPSACFWVPIPANDAGGAVSADMLVSYDVRRCRLTGIRTTPQTDGFAAAAADRNGKVRIGMAGTRPLNGNVTLLELGFEPADRHTAQAGDNERQAVRTPEPGLDACSLQLVWLVLDEREPAKLGPPSNAEGRQTELPQEFSLDAPAPNPFRSGTQIGYALPKAGWVEVSVYDITGRPVRVIAQGYQMPGRYSLLWDGCDDRNRQLKNGVYVIRMRTDGFLSERKTILLNE